MIGFQQMPTLSTMNDYSHITNKINIDEEKDLGEIPEWIRCTSKRFKNLVECYLCKIEDCQILFETKEELNEHKQTHNKLYKCNFPTCEKSFMKAINLRRHLKSHYKNKNRFYCPYEGCNKSYSAFYSLTLHYRIHTGITLYKCEKCEKKFFGRSNYQYHVNNIHKNLRIEQSTCPHKNCGHKSKSIKQLLIHHDKLEDQCVIEKNLLLKLIMLYQKASISLLNINDDEKIKNFEQIGVDEENRILWINAVNSCKLDDDLKNELNHIEIQSKNVIHSSKNKNKYTGYI